MTVPQITMVEYSPLIVPSELINLAKHPTRRKQVFGGLTYGYQIAA